MYNLTFYLVSEPKAKLGLNKAATSGIIPTEIGYSQFSELCALMVYASFSQKLRKSPKWSIYGRMKNSYERDGSCMIA